MSRRKEAYYVCKHQMRWNSNRDDKYKGWAPLLIPKREDFSMDKVETGYQGMFLDDDNLHHMIAICEQEPCVTVYDENNEAIIDEHDRLRFYHNHFDEKSENSKKELDGNYDGFVKSIEGDLQSFKKKTLDKI